ncbi:MULTISPECIES: DUF2007 domain-containing protein [unclassified Algibacter]|uniref:DUF2007 domain-containing protein n=1 Tax=unclassified Algibacter TaxID=2615009 RepID=UPI00131BEB24|nr:MULTISPECIES: DUF2007 domain-containing protein [unclassified Algibacter]MCL5128333.1 DUF2007 domain-containing protein [Algibacter sp. L4_22]
MKNYIKVFTGNLNDVQRVFNDLAALNICAVIRAKSKFERINYPGDLNQTLQDILVHKDELERATDVIDHLMGKNTSKLVQNNSNSKPIRRNYA